MRTDCARTELDAPATLPLVPPLAQENHVLNSRRRLANLGDKVLNVLRDWLVDRPMLL